MQEDLLHILSQSNKDIDNQKLMDYLSGKLSKEQQHEVEQWMVDDPFLNEAMEGLQRAKNPASVNQSVDQINSRLKKYLQQRRKKRSRYQLPVNKWTYTAVLVILALLVLVYLVIHLRNE